MFNADPTLFYNAQQSLIDGFDSLEGKRSEIEDLTSSFPRGFEYKNEITEVTQDLKSIITELSSLTRRVSDTKDSLIKLDNLFGLIYYECASSKYDNLHGRLTSEEKAYVEFAQSQYNKMLFQYLDDLNRSANLTPEMESVYEQLKVSNKLSELEDKLVRLKEGSKEYESVLNQYNKELDNMLNLQIAQLENKDSLTEAEQSTLKSLKDAKNISAYEKELAELEKNPVRNPGVPGGRMTEAQAKAYAEQSKAYWDYANKKKDLKNKIKTIQKENGTYVNKWYEDIGESITKTSAQWKKGFTSAFKGEGLGELGEAVKQTAATGAVVYKSAQNGVLKVGELLFDGATAVVGSVAAGVTWLAHDSWSDNDVAGNVMDWTLDEMRKDRVGDANKNFYENTELGKWINQNSNLKYDSAGAQSIQTATEFAGKVVLATAATVASGGAAAAAIGAVYGIGKAGEKYTQSVDRENGDDYNYLKFLGKSAAGGLSGAAEFYGYGQMGASIYGGIKSLSGAATSLASNTTTKTATTFGKSFAKNFLEVDTFLDSGAVIVDHGVNLATGDETLSESLRNAGIEFGLALGLNAIGAGIGAKIETKAAKIDIDTSSLPRESTSVKKILGDKISVVSTKVKTAGINFAESLKNAKTKLDLMVINISTNPTVNNILSSPMMAELATNSDSAILFGSTSFIKESLNVLANKRAVKEVIENADFTQKILKEGMVHFTPNEDVADAIISSQVLKTKKLGFDINHPIKSVKNDVEYLANQGSKAFLFGGIPSYEEMVLNVDIQPTMVGVRIKPDESQLANLGYRYLDDNALIHNGDLDLSPSKSVEKVYVGLKQDKATNRFYYEEITKAEFDNYKLDIDESEFKKLKSTLAKTKTQIDLTYGNMKSKLDAKIIDDGTRIQKETFNTNVDTLRKTDNYEEMRKLWQDDLNAVFGEENVEAEDINTLLWLSSKHGSKPEWENVYESDFIESLYLKKDTLSTSQIEELKNNKYWQRLVVEEQEKYTKFVENLEEWKNSNELKILSDDELRNISKIENYSEARKAYNNARYTYLTKNLGIDLDNVPDSILTTEVLGLHHNIADKINNNGTSYYKKVCMADLVGSTTRPGTNPDGLVSEFYLRDNGSTFLEKFLKENRYDYNAVQNMNVDIVDSIKQKYPDINLGEPVETGNLLIDLLEHNGKYYVGGDGNHRMVVAKLKYMQEIANAKTVAEIAEINSKYTFTLPVRSLNIPIPEVKVSNNFIDSLDEISLVKSLELSSNINKNTFDSVYGTLYNKYGKEEALSRISKYIETGNANVITRDNNARTLISSLSMEELTKHVDDIKGASYFKVAEDLVDNNGFKVAGDLESSINLNKNIDGSYIYTRSNGTKFHLRNSGSIQLSNGNKLYAFTYSDWSSNTGTRRIYSEENLIDIIANSDVNAQTFILDNFLADSRVLKYCNNEFGYIGFMDLIDGSIVKKYNIGYGKKILNETANDYYNFLKNNPDLTSNNSFGVDQHITHNAFMNDNGVSDNLVEHMVNNGMSYQDSVEFLKHLDSKGACSYASACNEILVAYKDNPNQFFEDFGFSMYLADEFGNQSLNTSQLLADIYLYVNNKNNGLGGELLNYDNGILSINARNNGIIDSSKQKYLANSNGRVDYYIDNYLKSKNFNLSYNSRVAVNTFSHNYNVKNRKLYNLSDEELYEIKKDVHESMQRGQQVSMSFWDNPKSKNKVCMFDENGNIKVDTKSWGGTEGKGAGHSVYITSVMDDGVWCSSWGQSLFMPWEDLRKMPINITIAEIGGIS